MKKPGRKPLPRSKRKRNAVHIYLTDAEYRELRYASRLCVQAPAEYAKGHALAAARDFARTFKAAGEAGR